ncbi:Os08g0132400 [Oryza sativa Japonica Group]|uniref:Os08g0132400 protein n=2 Tax=Oryza sativa subsp. japonica TaxID=39947 RepID=Q0J871_ORYSJ|nr:hypothetical protein DAI22_08g228000 [Oryza sativa Japonica Group]BAF22844.1 Os08g0132400 [Oryza sativa Japonica Group]BAT03712.1 Os08g0132400 [Oryza sativa Japonica Group]|eukprot:NP_001060930.1 Os08g0132400 [Oryza sativa Japonica Group]
MESLWSLQRTKICTRIVWVGVQFSLSPSLFFVFQFLNRSFKPCLANALCFNCYASHFHACCAASGFHCFIVQDLCRQPPEKV